MNAKGTPDRADDTMTSYSSKGPTAIDHIANPDIVAPGNAVVSLQASGATLVKQNPSNRPALSTYETGKGDLSKPSDAYFVLSGTSMATPMVSAAAALLIQQHPSLTPDQIKARLMKTAYKNLPPSITIVSGGQTFVEQADVFTVGAGYLDLQTALSDSSVSTLTAKSPRLSSISLQVMLIWHLIHLVCGEATPCGVAQRSGERMRSLEVRVYLRVAPRWPVPTLFGAVTPCGVAMPYGAVRIRPASTLSGEAGRWSVARCLADGTTQTNAMSVVVGGDN